MPGDLHYIRIQNIYISEVSKLHLKSPNSLNTTLICKADSPEKIIKISIVFFVFDIYSYLIFILIYHTYERS